MCQNSNFDTVTLRAVKLKLEDLQDRDWYYRRILDSVRIRFHMSSPEYKSVLAQMDSSDKVNQSVLIPILARYGWLGRSQVGERANDAIFKVIQHAPLDIQLKYVPQMRESVAKGESKESDLERLEDRVLIRQDKPTKYGTQGFDVQRKDGSIDIYTDRRRANEERKKEGLDTIPAPFIK